MIQKFSSRTDVPISQIKNNVYRIIETGTWWKLDAFFSDLNLALRENDTTMMNELSKGKPNIKVKWQITYHRDGIGSHP